MPSATRESSDPLEDFCRRRGKQSKACRARAAAASAVQLHTGSNASMPRSKKDSADYFEDFCQRRGQQSKFCRAQRRANKMAKKWEQASQSTEPMQRVGGSSCTWENGCCTQRPRARECRQASSLRPTAAAICARRGNESAAPLAASLWTRALSLPIFCSERQLQASGEWLRYLSFVYLSGTLSFPIDTRPFTMFYPGPLLPSAVASATVHRAEGVGIELADKPLFSHAIHHGARVVYVNAFGGAYTGRQMPGSRHYASGFADHALVEVRLRVGQVGRAGGPIQEQASRQAGRPAGRSKRASVPVLYDRSRCATAAVTGAPSASGCRSRRARASGTSSGAPSPSRTVPPRARTSSCRSTCARAGASPWGASSPRGGSSSRRCSACATPRARPATTRCST